MDLALVIGEKALSREEQKHLQFARAFEDKFVKQGKYTRRDIEETLNLGAELVKMVQEG
jgi:V/A-type H+-transporting ATPase subunit B